MLVHIRRSLVLAIIVLILTFAYTYLSTGVDQVLFKHQANGSITPNGSTLIGQNWSQAPCPGHPLGSCVFQGRPDAVGPYAGSLSPVAGGGDNPLEANNVPGKPGVYRSIAFLRPHFQLDELTVSLRLVAELPKGAR